MLALAQRTLIVPVLYLFSVQLLPCPALVQRTELLRDACAHKTPADFGVREEALSWWSIFLDGMIAYVLLSAIVVGFWGMRAIRFQQFEIAGGNLQPTLCRWLEDSGLRTKIVFDPAWDFGLLATMSDGEPVYIVQLKEHRRFVTFQASLAIPAEQQAILKAMPGAYFEKLEEEVALTVFLAKMVLAIRTRLSEVSLFSQLAITDLTEGAFFKHLDDMDNAILLARRIVLQAVERAPRLVSPRDMRVDEQG